MLFQCDYSVLIYWYIERKDFGFEGENSTKFSGVPSMPFPIGTQKLSSHNAHTMSQRPLDFYSSGSGVAIHPFVLVARRRVIASPLVACLLVVAAESLLHHST